MTREEQFRSSFTIQFTAAGGMPATNSQDTTQLALSDFPSYSLTLGLTRYDDYSGGGTITGSQDFVFRIFFQLPERQLDLMLHTRSDFLLVMEQFLRFGYTPPTPMLGDNYSIDALIMEHVLAPVMDPSMTRQAVAIKGRYLFTML